MIGTPYWGDTTFSQTHEVLNYANKYTLKDNKVDEKINAVPTFKERVLSLTILETRYNQKFDNRISITDVRTLLYVLAKLDFMFIMQDTETNKNFLTWCKDVRFNYRDGELFIPYYTYDTVDVPYNNKNDLKFVDMVEEGTMRLSYEYGIKKYVLHKSKGVDEVDCTLDSIFVLYDKDEHATYSLELLDLPLIDSIVFSLDELLDLYKEACYAEVNSLQFASDETYFKLNGKHVDRVGKVKRAYYHLPLYKSKFTPLKYTDLRMYSYRELKGVVEPENPVPHWERTMLFESLLYSVFACQLEPKDHPNKDAFIQLGITLRHVKIGSGEPSLILKHYYKNNSQLKLKSFEWR